MTIPAAVSRWRWPESRHRRPFETRPGVFERALLRASPCGISLRRGARNRAGQRRWVAAGARSSWDRCSATQTSYLTSQRAPTAHQELAGAAKQSRGAREHEVPWPWRRPELGIVVALPRRANEQQKERGEAELTEEAHGGLLGVRERRDDDESR